MLYEEQLPVSTSQRLKSVKKKKKKTAAEGETFIILGSMAHDWKLLI